MKSVIHLEESETKSMQKEGSLHASRPGTGPGILKQTGSYRLIAPPRLSLCDSSSAGWRWPLDDREKKSPGAHIMPREPGWATCFWVEVPAVRSGTNTLRMSGAA